MKIPLDLDRLNYSELSRKTGLSLSYISLVFRGRRRPSTDASAAIAKALSKIKGFPISMDALHLALAQKRAEFKREEQKRFKTVLVQ